MQKQTRVRALVSPEARYAIRKIALENKTTVTEVIKQGLICWSRENLSDNEVKVKELQALLYPRKEK